MFHLLIDIYILFTLSCFCSELVVIFLKFLYDQDPVRQLLEPSEVDHDVDVDLWVFSFVTSILPSFYLFHLMY